MAESSIDVDRIVREVIAELGLARDTGATGGLPAGIEHDSHLEVLADKPPVAPASANPATATRPEGDLVITCRVVTLSEVGGRLESVRRLVVSPQAVITPAVRDELQRRNVTLAFATPTGSPSAGRLGLVLVTAGKRFDPTTLVGALSKEAIDVQRHTSDCLIAATDLLAGEVVRPDTLGLLLARETAAALCLANRHRGVRAVSGAEAPAVSAAVAAVGANLLVIDPTAWRFFQLKQIVTEFCRGGTRQCPEVFRERLA